MEPIEPVRRRRPDERVAPVPSVRPPARDEDRERERRERRERPQEPRTPEGPGPHVDVLA